MLFFYNGHFAFVFQFWHQTMVLELNFHDLMDNINMLKCLAKFLFYFSF